jgi:hypothetical protein
MVTNVMYSERIRGKRQGASGENLNGSISANLELKSHLQKVFQGLIPLSHRKIMITR